MRVVNVKNGLELFTALKHSHDHDTILIKPGVYFSPEKSVTFKLHGNLTIIGQSSEAMDTLLNCSFTIAEDTVIYLRNLSMTYDFEQTNTIALYNGARLYGDNINVNHTSSNQHTFFCQNSFVSLKNSFITTEDQRAITSLVLRSSQMIAIDSSLNVPYPINSTLYLKNSTITNTIVIKKNSKVYFTGLTLDKANNREYSDIFIDGKSLVNGRNLKFTSDDSFISVHHSNFQNVNFESELDKIHWNFDDDSLVLADGNRPINNAD